MIFVCENNGFAEFTPRSAHTNGRAGQRRGRAVRLRAPDGRRQRRAGASGRRSRVPRQTARAGRGPYPARVPDAPPTRSLRGRRRRRTARRSPTPSGPRVDPIARLQASVRRARLARRVRRRRRCSDEARAEVEARGRVRAREPVPLTPELAARLVVRDDDRDHVRRGDQRRRLARAMRADERVIVLGEDVAEGGPYLATAGLAEEFGTRARAQHADQRGRGLRRRDRRRAGGATAGGRDHVHRLHHAGARPARQPGGQGALHVRRPAVGAARAAHPGRRRAARAAPSTRRASRRG